ncbi:MAG: hypothetical protein IKK17_07780 [Oscillospiraceae bacterium]|nr:hypothetical protein [Oscillospiraceae bacterium]
MTIVEALNLRAAFAKIKCQLAEGGIDVSEIKTVKDLPAFMSSILPAELVPRLMQDENIKRVLEDDWLAGLLTAFANEARAGGIVKDMILGSEIVKEDDLNG